MFDKNSNVYHSLICEYENNLKLQEQARRIIADLPKGTIQKVKRKNRYYYYLKFRDGTKSVMKYLGPVDVINIDEYTQRIESRKEQQCRLRTLEKEARNLQKALGIKSAVPEIKQTGKANKIQEGISWENFKSALQHELKEKGFQQFISDSVRYNVVEKLWQDNKKKECLYMVAMIDYLCRIHDLGMYSGYDQYRKYKLEKPLYPQDMRLAMLLGIDIPESHSIPEFERFNFIEGEINNVY